MSTQYIKISNGQNEFLATEASVNANPFAKSDPKYCEHLDTPFASGFGYDDTSKYPDGIEIVGFVEIP